MENTAKESRTVKTDNQGVKRTGLFRWDVTGVKHLSLAEYVLGLVKPDEVTLEFVANGVCGSDNHMYETGAIHPGHNGPHKPLTLGHEIIARVAGKGEGVKNLNVGDMVAVEPGIPCGTCPNCRYGKYHCCPSVLYMGTPPQSGGLADRFNWPATWCHKLPKNLADNPVLASLVEPLAACRQAVQLGSSYLSSCPIAVSTDANKGDCWAVIVGSGSMALGVLAMLKAMLPEQKVMVIARNKQALDFAASLGADRTLALVGQAPTAVATQILEQNFGNESEEFAAFCSAVNVNGDSIYEAAGRAACNAAELFLHASKDMEEARSKIWSAACDAAKAFTGKANTQVFKTAQEITEGRINLVIECTGDELLLQTIIGSRILLGDGAIVALGCHYRVDFDVAHLRRSELALITVRRSAWQFPDTIKMLSERPELFTPLIGGTVPFEEFGNFMAGTFHAVKTGTGGPKIVITR